MTRKPVRFDGWGGQGVSPRCPRTAINSQRSPSGPSEPEGKRGQVCRRAWAWHGSWHGAADNPSAASATSAISRAIGAGSAHNARCHGYGKERSNHRASCGGLRFCWRAPHQERAPPPWRKDGQERHDSSAPIAATGWVQGENDLVAESAVETLAAVELGQVGMVVANDSGRSSFSVDSGDDLLALDADLNLLHRWPLGLAKRGWHSSSPGRGLALISGPNEVRLLGEAGQTIWAYPHSAWSGAFEAGCTWFDAAGEPYAVIPAASYDHCLVIRFGLESGAPLAEAAISAAPAVIEPVHHPDGWVGLSEGEGQDAARAWWVRSATSPGGPPRIEVRDAGWDHWVLSDVDHSGGVIITTPHRGRPLVVRSFPRLEVLLSVDPPSGDEFWGLPRMLRQPRPDRWQAHRPQRAAGRYRPERRGP